MTWQLFDTEINGIPSQVLLDDSFSKERPSDDLPNLARLRVGCQQTPEGGYWHPDESSALDHVENDLLGLAQQFGHGWAVYVRRVDSPGLREYDLYFGGDADLSKIVPSLMELHPGYRIQWECTTDLGWQQYASWLAAMAQG